MELATALEEVVGQRLQRGCRRAQNNHQISGLILVPMLAVIDLITVAKGHHIFKGQQLKAADPDGGQQLLFQQQSIGIGHQG